MNETKEALKESMEFVESLTLTDSQRIILESMLRSAYYKGVYDGLDKLGKKLDEQNKKGR